MFPAGLEPTSASFGGWCAIHCATETSCRGWDRTSTHEFKARWPAISLPDIRCMTGIEPAPSPSQGGALPLRYIHSQGDRTRTCDYSLPRRGFYQLNYSLLCVVRESNPHVLRHRFLRPACLPIPPTTLIEQPVRVAGVAVADVGVVEKRHPCRSRTGLTAFAERHLDRSDNGCWCLS